MKYSGRLSVLFDVSVSEELVCCSPCRISPSDSFLEVSTSSAPGLRRVKDVLRFGSWKGGLGGLENGNSRL